MTYINKDLKNIIQNYVFDKILHDVRYYEAGNPIRGDMGYLEEIK